MRFYVAKNKRKDRIQAVHSIIFLILLRYTMPIEFDSKGNPKPYGIVGINLERFEELFSKIPDTDRREHLFSNLRNYICDFYQTLFPNYWIQWFGGSYTSNKELPGDIDVVNLVDCDNIDPVKIKPFLTLKDMAVTSKATYSVHGFLLPIFEKSDPRYEITEHWLQYWQNWFGKDRDNNPKTLVEVSYNDIL